MLMIDSFTVKFCNQDIIYIPGELFISETLGFVFNKMKWIQLSGLN
jgi:hypothetical protein